jgi:hypothetical protein
MPGSRGYSSHLSGEAVAFVVALPRRQQKIVLDFADRIAEQPFRIGDYQTSDAAGRAVENLLLEQFLFTYWVDHAAREVRITEIVKV